MNKSFLLWMGVVLMMVIGMSSCSSDDDDYNYVQEFGDNNNKENFIGTWHLLHYYTGWGIKEDYEAGEVTVTFTKNGEMQVINKRDDQHPFSTGNMAYYFVQLIFHHIVLPLIKDFFTFLKKPTTVMVILSKNWNKSPMHKVY